MNTSNCRCWVVAEIDTDDEGKLISGVEHIHPKFVYNTLPSAISAAQRYGYDTDKCVMRALYDKDNMFDVSVGSDLFVALYSRGDTAGVSKYFYSASSVLNLKANATYNIYNVVYGGV